MADRSDKISNRILIALVLLAAILIPVAIASGPNSLARVQRQGRLRLITRNAPTTYYVYRNQPMGFEYDLVSAFAEQLGVELEVVSLAAPELLEALAAGVGDLVAAGVTGDPEAGRRFAFSEPYYVVRQELITHASDRGVRELADLIGRRLTVPADPWYIDRLEELRSGGLDIEIDVREDLPAEELIRRVGEGGLSYTVADTNIARLNRRYYPNMRIAFSVSGPRALTWAVRRGDNRLLRRINGFLEDMEASGELERLYDRYFANADVFDSFDIRVFHRRVESRLPNYVEAIKRESEEFGFDWRLIAAMAYQESHYFPVARSYTGVEGFMQVTEATAEIMGIEDRRDPEQSIYAGVKYLRYLFDRFDDVPSRWDQLLISMAAYNVGYGHIRDAQTLAERLGLAPSRWQSLEQTLPLLRVPEYYRTLEHGYARGTEPVRYIERILTYYDILRQLATQGERIAR